MHILILAGGGGTRLWPLSRDDMPKQFLCFQGSLSLLQKTVSRFLNSHLTETLCISTNTHYESLVRQQLAKIDAETRVDVIVEPTRRNTAPAIAYAIRYLETKKNLDESASILVLPSDHLIEPESVFLDYLKMAAPVIEKDRLVIFGIRPTKPETGYGYIQIGAKEGVITHFVKRFVEKPNLTLAETYLSLGDYYWNAGMFAFTVRHFWKSLLTYAPAIHSLSQTNFEKIFSQFSDLPDISFDYAVLEKCPDTLVCPLPVGWSDVGCWDSVYDTLEKDENQNVKIGNILDIETKNSLIIGNKRLISTIGLEDMLIVETEDAMVISKKGESQKVKSIVQELKRIGRREGSSHNTKTHSWGTVCLLTEKNGFSLEVVEIFPKESWAVPFQTTQKLTLLQGTAIAKNSSEKETTLTLLEDCSKDISIITNVGEASALFLRICLQYPGTECSNC